MGWYGMVEGMETYRGHRKRVPEVTLRPRQEGRTSPYQAESRRRVRADRHNSRSLPPKAMRSRNSWPTSQTPRVVAPVSCSGIWGIRLSCCRTLTLRIDVRIPCRRTQRWAWTTPDDLIFSYPRKIGMWKLSKL